jgi:hypothetical protein
MASCEVNRAERKQHDKRCDKWDQVPGPMFTLAVSVFIEGHDLHTPMKINSNQVGPFRRQRRIRM